MCPFLTSQRILRLVSLAENTMRLVGATSGLDCRVCIIRDGWLKGLEPTMFTCFILNLKGIYKWRETKTAFLILRSCSWVAGGRGILDKITDLYSLWSSIIPLGQDSVPRIRRQSFHRTFRKSIEERNRKGEWEKERDWRTNETKKKIQKKIAGDI